MEQLIQGAMSYWWIAAILILIVSFKWWVRVFGIVIIPDNHMGLVNVKMVFFGANKSLPDGKIIALNGEPGYQADTLASGLKYGYWPWKYQIDIIPFLVIPEKKLGLVQAHDGASLKGGAVIAKHVECDAFQNARQFLEGGGQRGPQISIIPPGTYRVNTQLFRVTLCDAMKIADGTVGIVTALAGKSLDTGKGEIAGPIVPGHDSFQNGQAFIDAGGCKGLQEEVILAGLYYYNPMLIGVEMNPLTEVALAHVGVVTAFVGEVGEDLTGTEFKHANLFAKGKRGVWKDPMDPGRYPINPHTHRIESVPTASIVLNWADSKNEAHNLDKGLNTIRARSKDGFEISLDVSQIIHVSRENAAMVIARFGNMNNLVSQILEPIIGNYFRNAVQDASALDFLQQRGTQQQLACVAIREKLKDCNIEAVDTLIGDLIIPNELLRTQTERQIAKENEATYVIQQAAEKGRVMLAEQTALADTQKEVVSAQRRLTVAQQDALTAAEKATGEANAARTRAEATAYTTEKTGEADAKKIELVGKAEADVIEQKKKALGAENFTRIEVAAKLSQSMQPLVPKYMLGGGENGGGANGLLNLVLADRVVRSNEPEEAPTTPAPETSKAA
ncbi:MAG: SPFH domain-containing protein [Candidatus Uhrbacteria bacterium]|nr:SPFH domain-containing protein [Candidatus Uhrbacteria bacterium]